MSDPMDPSPLPFYFAWVDETEKTFDPSTMSVVDEDIFSFDIKHDEGQVPTLDIVIENPRVGLLAPSRKLWAWLAWQSPADDEVYHGAIVPLFFGVVVGVPTNLFQQKVTLQFIARSPTFIADKQAVAETMKAPPYYDPIWISEDKRDDPDTILEGWSSLWHIDRTTLDITASDILEGEDGTMTFDEDMAFYDSVTLKLGQPPLTNLRVEATVTWQQRTSGTFDVPQVNISSYTGGSLASDWPKPGGAIGGGYKCESSFVTDTFLVSETPTTNYAYSWTNTDPNPGQCSTASTNITSSGPALLAPNPLTATLTYYLKSGLCFPDSDPPQNNPLEVTASGILVPLWNLSMDMTIRYDAQRDYSENISFDMIANTQGILASPTVEQNTELMTLSSVDISKPLLDVDAWTDFAGKPVPIATIIYPNNPTTPGGLSHQIAINSGVAGTVEPVFSDLPGVLVGDGSVVWASLGAQGPTDAPDWSPASFVPAGQIICFTKQLFNDATGQFEIQPGQASYYLCTTGGQTNGAYVEFEYTPPRTTNTGPDPVPVHIFIINRPNFDTNVGDRVQDGSVVWTVLGAAPASLGIPIGGTVDNVTARFFFPSARGQQSLEYLISRARARLRFRARAVAVGWSARFRDVVAASCRKNATLFDPRIPGGACTGKITGYQLSAGSGRIIGTVNIGCSIGFGDSINEITGTPEYVALGYVEDDYQVFDGAMIAHGSGDITYTPPVFVGFDDGLKYPLRWQDVSDGGLVSGSLAEQEAAITKSFSAAQQLEFLNNVGGSITQGQTSTTISGRSPDTAWFITREQIILAQQDTPYVMNANPITWSCLLKPCAGNGPFEGAYAIGVSPLVVPQGINLEAPSSP